MKASSTQFAQKPVAKSDELNIDVRPVEAARADSHMPALDGLRGIAISLVIIAHCSTELHWTSSADWATKILHRVTTVSTCGVDLFFVLSGFLITGILLRSKKSPKYFSSFYARRALRIFPLYYAVLAVVLIGGAALWGPQFTLQFGPQADQPWLWLYGTNIVQSVRADYVYGRFLHLWSLAVEEHFYLVWPLLVFWLKEKWLLAIAAASIVGSPIIRYGFTQFHDSMAAYVLTCCRTDSLLIGCAIAVLCHMNVIGNLNKASRVLSVCLLTLVFAAILLLPFDEEMTRIYYPTMFAFLFGAILIQTVLLAKSTRFLEDKTLRMIGKYSYGLYVYHFLVITELDKHWHTSLPPILNYSAFLAATTIISLTIAIVSYELYEKHFLKLKRYFTT